MLSGRKANIRSYIVATVIPLAVGILSALLTKENMNIYAEVKTPPLAPPGFLFPVVWTILYILMGISSAVIWNRRENNLQAARSGLMYYIASLAFNFTWSIIFFNLRSFLVALAWLLVLLYLIVCTVVEYKKVYQVAAYLQIPYIVWVSFAGYLNAGIWWLNTVHV